MRLLLLSRISSLVLATSFVLNLLAVLELRDVQKEERRIQAVGQQALTEVALIRAELLAMQKFVAVYVATSDSRWLIHYYDIADVHAGRKAFVTQPAPTYWDNLLAGMGAPIPTQDRTGIALQDRMIGLDIAGDNRVLTLNLLESSRRLRERERIIFAATQGLYDVKAQRFVSDAPPNPAYATSVMYSQAHLQLGNEVDGYLNTLFDDIQKTLQERSLLMQERTSQAGTLLLILSLLSGLLLLLFIYLLRMGILKPLEKMASTSGRVAEGDYSATIPESRVVEEIGVLAAAMNRMIRAVRFDLMQKDLARKATEAMYRAEQAREKAELETRIKSRFLANMTHELRTPLNAVIGLSQLLFKTDLTLRQRNYVGKVVDAGKFLLGLVNDILDFSKAEAGKITLESQPVNVAKELESALSLLSLQAEQKGIALVADIGIPRNTWVLTDSLRLRQILTNLLSNAVKFTHAGEVRLIGETAPADGGTNGGANTAVDAQTAGLTAAQTLHLRIQVKDTGIGMSREQIAQAFEEFHQADQSTTRLYGGTGLGLTIVKRLVDALQGSIQIESQSGQGTTFSLEFALQACEAPAEETSAVDQASAPLQTPETPEALETSEALDSLELQPLVEGKLKGLSIVLVEDNPINQEVARDTLELEGATVTVCENGKEAVDYFSQPDAMADLVLMDIEMPVMDGYAATTALRRQFDAVRLPILGMTAHAFEEARDKCLHVGMNNVMTKPFDIDRLAGWIRENLNRERKADRIRNT